MATRVEDDRVHTRSNVHVARNSDETKAAFKTTEMMAFVATVAGVLVASAIDDTIDARLAWILVTALTVGYMLSRGFAKSGSREPYSADERS